MADIYIGGSNIPNLGSGTGIMVPLEGARSLFPGSGIDINGAMDLCQQSDRCTSNHKFLPGAAF